MLTRLISSCCTAFQLSSKNVDRPTMNPERFSGAARCHWLAELEQSGLQYPLSKWILGAVAKPVVGWGTICYGADPSVSILVSLLSSQVLRMRSSIILSLALVSGNVIGFGFAQASSQGTQLWLQSWPSPDFLIAPTTKINAYNSTSPTAAAVGNDGSCCFIVQDTVSVASWASKLIALSKRSSTNRVTAIATYTATIFITSVIQYLDTAVTSVKTSTKLTTNAPFQFDKPSIGVSHYPDIATQKITLNGTKTESFGTTMYEDIRSVDTGCLTECHTEHLPLASWYILLWRLSMFLPLLGPTVICIALLHLGMVVAVH